MKAKPIRSEVLSLVLYIAVLIEKIYVAVQFAVFIDVRINPIITPLPYWVSRQTRTPSLNVER